MKKNLTLSTKIKTFTLFLIVLISSISINNFADYSSKNTGSENSSEVDDEYSEINPFETIESPKLSTYGNDSWWNIDWLYRRLINVTNTNNIGLKNYPVEIIFNYTELVNEGKMNSSCKDIRIVEQGIIRKYYFQINYPSSNLVTVWFETNITSGPNTVEYDTYLYYGNMDSQIDTDYFMNESSSSSADAFGWIRNGDFEWDNEPFGEPKVTSFFGWDYSNAPPTDIDAYDGEQNPSSYEHRLLDTALNQERIFEGGHTFKWGDVDHFVDSTTINLVGQDYEGWIYSYPFIIPIVTGVGQRLYFTLYINARSYSDQVNVLSGFVIRISNATNYGEAGSSLGTYTIFQNYGTISKQTTNTLLNLLKGSGPNPAETRNTTESIPPFSKDGQLTGKFSFDVTDYGGQCVFFEACTYGPETGKKRSVFAQIDDIKYDLELTAGLEFDEQKVQSEITVITKDTDGRIVPGAEVSLVDLSGILLPEPRTQFTDSTGATLFSNIGWGTYNFTVNYTLPLPSGKEAKVYDSTKPGERNFVIDASQTAYEFILTLNMSTIDFEIVDVGNRPLNHGFVNIMTEENGESLQNLTLDSNGKATFRWLNASSYYYEVYYNNIDYNNIPIKLNASYIFRSDYVKNEEKFQIHTFWVNQTNLTPGTTYYVEQYLYTNSSLTGLENKKIINFTITLTDMDNFLTNVSIYYIDASGSTEDNLIFTNTSYAPSDNSDEIKITLRDPPITCANLIADNYEAYGLLVIIKGINNTMTCNGIISVNLVETWNIYIKTPLARVNIQVTDKGIPVDVAKVLVTTGPPDTKSIINLTSYVDKGDELLDSEGWVYGRINYLIPFWFFIEWSYNISLTISGQPIQFKINKTLTGEWEAKDIPLWNYNFTLSYDSGNIILETYTATPIQIQTMFVNNKITEEVVWGDIIDVSINYTYTIYGDSWLPMPDTGNVYIQFKTVGIGGIVYIIGKMNYTGSGILIYTLNSSQLSAGYDAQSYIVTIFADESEYVNPNNLNNYTVVIAIPSGLTILSGYPDFEVVTEYSQHFGEYVNISIFYYDNETKQVISGASVFYDWLNLGNIQFYSDPVNTSVYTASLDTTLAGSIGLKSIKLTIYKENYTIQQNILISLDVLKRPTTINNQSELLYINSKIWVEDANPFNFTYTDVLSTEITGDLNVAVYSWQELDEAGNIITGKSGNGILIQNPDKIYTLNFNTEIIPEGYYQLYVTFQKDNYEERFALINLEIMLREFDADIGATSLKNDQINVVKGEDIEFEIELLDETRGNIPLTGAKVTLEIGGDEYEFDEDEPGVYILTIKTNKIEAFYTSKTFTAQISIKKANFTSQDEDITIVVEMEQIFEGIPIFYFIMLIAIIAGVVGSLVSYRVVQQAKIPGYVKKLRKVKKTIKTGKPMTESYSNLTLENMIIKQFSEDWQKIGYSIESIYGMKEGKSLDSIKDKIIEKKGDNI